MPALLDGRKRRAFLQRLNRLGEIFADEAHHDVTRTALELIRTALDRQPVAVEDELARLMAKDMRPARKGAHRRRRSVPARVRSVACPTTTGLPAETCSCGRPACIGL